MRQVSKDLNLVVGKAATELVTCELHTRLASLSEQELVATATISAFKRSHHAIAPDAKMADITVLDALQAFHRELISLDAGYSDATDILNNELVVQRFESEAEKLWESRPKSAQSRNTIASGEPSRILVLNELRCVSDSHSGKISIGGQEFTINEAFQQDTLLLADELEIDEMDAAQCLFESQGDPSVLGRPLLECAVIRFHQQRKYTLDILRLLFELDGAEDDSDETNALETIRIFVAARLLHSGAATKGRCISRCMTAMSRIKAWLRKLSDKIAAAQALNQSRGSHLSEEMETVEFSRISLIQQHELLAVILCRYIEKRQAETSDFLDFVSTLQKVDRYDHLLGQCQQIGPASFKTCPC